MAKLGVCLPTSSQALRVITGAIEKGVVVKTDGEERRVGAGGTGDIVVLVRCAREILTAREGRC